MTAAAGGEPPWAAEAALRYQAGETLQNLERDYRTSDQRLRRLMPPGARLPREGSARRRILARLCDGSAMTARLLAEADGAAADQRVLTEYGQHLRALRDDGWVRLHERIPGACRRAPSLSYVITEAARQLMQQAAEAAARPRPPGLPPGVHAWDAEAAARYRAGETARALAAGLGANPGTVIRSLRRQGVPVRVGAPPRPRKPPPEWAAEAARRYRAGETRQALARVFKAGDRRLKAVLLAQGAELRGRGAPRRRPGGAAVTGSGPQPGQEIMPATVAMSPRWVQCAAGIIDRLRDGRYPEGQVIPGLGGPGGICRDLGAAAGAAKKALTELAAKGYLARDGTSYYPGPFKPWEQTVKGSPDFAGRFTGADRYITVAELASMAQVSKTTAYHIARSGDIDDVKRVGSSIRIPFSGAEKYVTDPGFVSPAEPGPAMPGYLRDHPGHAGGGPPPAPAGGGLP